MNHAVQRKSIHPDPNFLIVIQLVFTTNIVAGFKTGPITI